MEILLSLFRYACQKKFCLKIRGLFPFNLRLSAVQLHFVGGGQKMYPENWQACNMMHCEKNASLLQMMMCCVPPAPKWAYSQCRLGESLRGIKINDPCREYITSSSRPHPSFSKNHISGFPRWSPNLRNALKYLCSLKQKVRSPIEAVLHVW